MTVCRLTTLMPHGGQPGAPSTDIGANNSVALAGTGAVNVPAAAFNGSTNTFSVWFKTTSASGVLLSKPRSTDGHGVR